MLLETKRLMIRPVEPADEAVFIDMAADGSLNDIGFDRQCGAWMHSWTKEAKELTDADDPMSDYLAYTIVLKDKDIVIGSVGCSYYDDLREVGITYFIGAQYRGRGYATEAVKVYSAYFLSRYDISKLIATIREANVPSWRTVEGAGFQLIEKKRYKDINDDEEEMYFFYEMKRA
ncbi:MAG: GNAT family N-acetyltransferase [Lachnospiraceae bacterium]|nr:GNAT family N-acetyltransferase [Lachnospiraceae bacterium]